MGTVRLGLPVPKRVLLRSTPAWGATRKKVFANSGEGISIRASAWDAARWRHFWEAKKVFHSMYPRGLKWGVAGLIGGDCVPLLLPLGLRLHRCPSPSPPSPAGRTTSRPLPTSGRLRMPRLRAGDGANGEATILPVLLFTRVPV